MQNAYGIFIFRNVQHHTYCSISNTLLKQMLIEF